MKMNRFTTSVGFVIIGLCTLSFADRATGQETTVTSPDSDKLEKGIGVRYARTNFKLAELELQIALDKNKKFSNFYSAAIVQRLRNNVEITKRQLNYQLHGEKTNLHDVHIHELEGAAKLAKLNLRSAIDVNNRLPGTISNSEIERLRLSAELARLALEKARDPDAVKSREAHFQWQLDQLRSQMLRMEIRLDRLTSRP